jgi:hypothetical protein
MGKHVLRIALVALLCLLLGTTALARPAEPAPSSDYFVAPGALSGPGYGLVGGTWQASGSASGPGFRLDPAGGRILQGAGCCCLYLPCVLRDQ